MQAINLEGIVIPENPEFLFSYQKQWNKQSSKAQLTLPCPGWFAFTAQTYDFPNLQHEGKKYPASCA